MILAQRNEVIALKFWEGTELGDIFPREIEKAIALKLPLAIVKLPRLTVPAVRRWLEARRLCARVPNDGRELMGCLVAYRGFGIVFVCGADAPEEQRLTVAHETGHFLRDYLLPRQQVLAALGDELLDVLDGRRESTPAERANAVLAHVRLGPHVHLLPKEGEAEDCDPKVSAAEERADGLGLELVAPREHILAIVSGQAHEKNEDICGLLSKFFGLPLQVFQQFVSQSHERRRIVSFVEDIRPALTGRN
ncbi:MAG TPA: hypothetical protein VEM96_00955 [Pyrinomonadaceae bacterium]|nr:hypothetical protein [Pyrinomonadaceae bacterium]